MLIKKRNEKPKTELSELSSARKSEHCTIQGLQQLAQRSSSVVMYSEKTGAKVHECLFEHPTLCLISAKHTGVTNYDVANDRKVTTLKESEPTSGI